MRRVVEGWLSLRIRLRCHSANALVSAVDSLTEHSTLASREKAMLLESDFDLAVLLVPRSEVCDFPDP